MRLPSYESADLFRTVHSRFDLIMFDQAACHIDKQSLSMAGVTAEFRYFSKMTHSNYASSFLTAFARSASA